MTASNPLVLASSSPRRRELLRNARIPFVVHPADVDESRREGEPALEFALRVATEKAEAVFVQRPSDFVLGADTIVLVEGQVLGKPGDEEEARAMLRRLSGRRHEVTTAVCLMGPKKAPTAAELETGDLKLLPGFRDCRSETSTVEFAELSNAEINDYVASGEPMDKAGAYAIQGIASRWASRVEGSYFNVMGLPVALVYRILRERGFL